MPKFKCRVVEDITCYVTLEVEADTEEEAAQRARDAWVEDGIGEKYEEVNEREVEVELRPGAWKHVETEGG